MTEEEAMILALAMAAEDEGDFYVIYKMLMRMNEEKVSE